MAEPTTVEEVVVTGKRKKPNFAVRAARTARLAVRDPGAFVKGAKELPGAVVRGVKTYAQTHTPQQFGADVVRTGKNIVSDVAENPVQTVLGALPFVGGAMSAIDTAKARESAADARARGDERTAQMYEQIAAASAGTILAGMIPGGRTVAKGLLKEGEQAAVKEAEKLAAKYGLPEFTTDLTPAQIEANLAAHMSGSKAPPVLYTGTSKDKDFTKLNVPRNGAWFTENPKSASDYALDNDSMNLKTDNYRDFYKVNTASRVMPVHVSAKNPYVVEDIQAFNDQIYKFGGDNYKRGQSILFDDLRRQGHDSVHLKSGTPGEDVWVALGKPAQVKSTMNRGTFDPNEPHLSKARGGLVEKYGL